MTTSKVCINAFNLLNEDKFSDALNGGLGITKPPFFPPKCNEI